MPLTRQLLDIISSLPRIAGGLLFHHHRRDPRHRLQPIESPAGRCHAGNSSGGRRRRRAANWTLHDFAGRWRAVWPVGIDLPVIEKLLNHTSGSFAGIVGVYQHHDFADEKPRARHLGEFHQPLVGGKPEAGKCSAAAPLEINGRSVYVLSADSGQEAVTLKGALMTRAPMPGVVFQNDRSFRRPVGRDSSPHVACGNATASPQ